MALTPSVAKGEQEDSNSQEIWGNQKTLEEACPSASSLLPNSFSQPTSPATSVYQVDTDGVLELGLLMQTVSFQVLHSEPVHYTLKTSLGSVTQHLSTPPPFAQALLIPQAILPTQSPSFT